MYACYGPLKMFLYKISWILHEFIRQSDLIKVLNLKMMKCLKEVTEL